MPRRARRRRGRRGRVPARPGGARRSGSTPRTPSRPPRAGGAGGFPVGCRRSPSTPDHVAARRGRSLRPHVLERAEPELVVVEEDRLVDAAHVLLAVLLDERVVRVARLPAVDDEEPAGLLHVPQELGADVAAAAAKERVPVAAGAVHAPELVLLRGVVHEDERDHRRPPRSWWARKKFSLPAVAIAALAEISSASAAAATTCAKR